MKRRGVVTGAAFVAPMIARAAAGCPLCISDTGAQLRAMLASDPAWHLAVTIAPFPAIIAVVALVRAATPFLCKDER